MFCNSVELAGPAFSKALSIFFTILVTGSNADFSLGETAIMFLIAFIWSVFAIPPL